MGLSCEYPICCLITEGVVQSVFSQQQEILSLNYHSALFPIALVKFLVLLLKINPSIQPRNLIFSLIALLHGYHMPTQRAECEKPRESREGTAIKYCFECSWSFRNRS